MSYDYIRVEPLSKAVGAEIGGVDLAKPPAEPALAEIRHAFGEYGVILPRAASVPRPPPTRNASPITTRWFANR